MNLDHANIKPLVSVAMITYNHEKYILKAINSVLEQKTNFVYEIVIGEDFSKDGTSEICQKMADEYPGKIRLLSTFQNLGMLENFRRTMEACNGKYVAICEGDDYWTDDLKLQKQIKFMQDNPEYGFTFHKYTSNVNRITENQDRKSYSISFYDTVKSGRWGTLTMVYKKKLLDFNIMSDFFSYPHGDFIINNLLAIKASGYYISEQNGAFYNKLDTGVASQSKWGKIIFEDRPFFFASLIERRELLNLSDKQISHLEEAIIRLTLNGIKSNKRITYRQFSYLIKYGKSILHLTKGWQGHYKLPQFLNS